MGLPMLSRLAVRLEVFLSNNIVLNDPEQLFQVLHSKVKGSDEQTSPGSPARDQRGRRCRLHESVKPLGVMVGSLQMQGFLEAEEPRCKENSNNILKSSDKSPQQCQK